MTIVQIFALTMPPQIMFQREFSRKIDADDYETFWRGLGHCHIRRSRK
jgi:hypothetical protein